MPTAPSDPHFFDCPSCKAFATLRRLSPKKRRRSTSDEYECSECHSRHGTEELDRESARRKASAP